MCITLALVVLLATNIQGKQAPAQSDFIAVHHGAPVNLNTVNTINTAAAVNFLVSGINVLLTWFTFIIPPSNARGRLTVLISDCPRFFYGTKNRRIL